MNDWFEFEYELCGHRCHGVLHRGAVVKIREYKEWVHLENVHGEVILTLTEPYDSVLRRFGAETKEEE